MQLNKQYNTATTLNDYFNKIEDIQEMSADGNIPIRSKELLATTYVNIKGRGIYDNDMEKWNKGIIYYNNWNNFRRNFSTAYNKQSKQTNARKQIQQSINHKVYLMLSPNNLWNK